MKLHDLRNFTRRVLDRGMKNAGYVYTAEGWMREDELYVKNLEMETPAGRATTTEYYRDGRLVRRDINVMTNGMILGTASGVENKENQV